MNALSLDYINSKSPYLVKLADDGDYVFQTAKKSGDWSLSHELEIRLSRSLTKEYPEGRPVFLKGSELLEYRTGMSL